MRTFDEGYLIADFPASALQIMMPRILIALALFDAFCCCAAGHTLRSPVPISALAEKDRSRSNGKRRNTLGAVASLHLSSARAIAKASQVSYLWFSWPAPHPQPLNLHTRPDRYRSGYAPPYYRAAFLCLILSSPRTPELSMICFGPALRTHTRAMNGLVQMSGDNHELRPPFQGVVI
jgi:hypothetical protein